jgi:hypothetical protein
MRSAWLVLAGLVAAPFTACGPDEKPQTPCRGPSINLVLTAENAPLPANTHINVRYGGNRDGEPYVLGQERRGPAVFCDEDHSPGGGPSVAEAEPEPGAGAGGAPNSAPGEVWVLRCGLYTQGPARLDAMAEGYEPIDDFALSLEDGQRCEVEIAVELQRLLDAGL